MKFLSLYFLGLLLFSGCANGQSNTNDHTFATLPPPKAGEKVATFAGGCFWSLSEGISELKGVNSVIAGYAGGTVKNPTYGDVCSRTTGHAEAVQVYYNPQIISYATLAEAFFYAHDPTTLNRQGPDEGTDYRSVAFYRTPQEKETLQAVIKKVNGTGHYHNPIVTQVVPYTILYAAENYHQGYYRIHTDNPYIRFVSQPKVMKLREAMTAQLKPEFKTNK